MARMVSVLTFQDGDLVRVTGSADRTFGIQRVARIGTGEMLSGRLYAKWDEPSSTIEFSSIEQIDDLIAGLEAFKVKCVEEQAEHDRSVELGAAAPVCGTDDGEAAASSAAG